MHLNFTVCEIRFKIIMAVQQYASCKVPVQARDNFMSDPFFKSAREVLDQAMKSMDEAFSKPKLCADCVLPMPNPGEIHQIFARLYAQSVENFQNIFNVVGNTPEQQVNHTTEPKDNCQILKNTNDHCSSTKEQYAFKPPRFEVIMDMANFRAQDISVNVQNNILEIYAVQEITDDTIFTTRSIRRKYKLPTNVHPKSLACNLSCDGVMVITAPWVN